MLLTRPEDALFEELEKIVQTLRYHLVEVNVRHKDGTAKVAVILWGDKGVGIDDCARVHRLILPRLEILFDQEDVVVEVSSPGLERGLKYVGELEIFKGKKAKILLEGASDWISGVLDGLVGDQLSLRTGEQTVGVPLEKISKAKLNDI